MNRIRIAPLLILISAASLALGAPVAHAGIGGTTLSGLHGFTAMAVDDAHGHMFATGSTSQDSSVVVLNDAGAVVTTLTGESGAGGMVVDGSTLYVARCGGDAIDVFDTATLAKTGSFAANVGGVCQLVEAGGRLWYSNDYETGTLHSVTLDSSHTETDTGIGLYDALLATSPGMPDRLVASEAGLSPTSAYVYDVSGASPVLTASGQIGSSSNARQIALSPDGATLYAATGSPYEIQAFSLPDLEPAGVYATGPYPNAVAVSPAGNLVAGGVDAAYTTDVFAWPTAGGTPKLKVDFGYGNQLFDRGLAFTSAGELFAIEQHGSGVVAHVYYPLAAKVAISVSSSASKIGYGKSTTVTVHLGRWGAGKPVSLYATPKGGSRTLVASGHADSHGNYSHKVSPKHTTVYLGLWQGDANHAADTATHTVSVRARLTIAQKGAYASSGGVREFHYSSSCWTNDSHCPQFSGHVAPVHAGVTVHFVMQRRSGSSWKTILKGSATTDSRGTARGVFKYSGSGWIGLNLRIRCSWAGDSTNLGSRSAWLPFRITS
jgi:hypothetical protein